MTESQFHSFEEFWPYYISEHSSRINRTLHFIGTLGVFIITAIAISTKNWSLLWILPFLGYGFAWVGHFIVEKNRPATFKHPLWSLRGDFKMFFCILTGRMSKELTKSQKWKSK